MIPSWAVVATVDEPGALVLAFVAHHLAIGASEVHVFLDRPDAATEAALRQMPGCVVTSCDDGHWQAAPMRKRPGLHLIRQMHNARLAYGRTRADWLLHCDADEFVRDASGLAQELAALPPEVVYLRLLVAERVWSPESDETGLFGGIFRHAIAGFDLIGPVLYGAKAAFFREGLTGHKAGKAIVRTGLDLRMGIHAPRGKPPHSVARSTRILHFDGLTRLHYMIKLLRRAHEAEVPDPRHGPSRIAQFEALRAARADPAARAALVAALKQLRHRQMLLLRPLQGLDERAFAPAMLPEVDLTSASFDTALRARHGGFLARHAPELAQDRT